MLKLEPNIRSSHMREEHNRNEELDTFQNQRVPYKSIYGGKTGKMMCEKARKFSNTTDFTRMRKRDFRSIQAQKENLKC